MGKILMSQYCSMGKPSYHGLKTGGHQNFNCTMVLNNVKPKLYHTRKKEGAMELLLKFFTSTVCSLLSTMVS
jgi:hypothetical protein